MQSAEQLVIAVTCIFYNLQPFCRTAMYDRTSSDECAEERSMIVPVMNAMDGFSVIWLSADTYVLDPTYGYGSANA